MCITYMNGPLHYGIFFSRMANFVNQLILYKKVSAADTNYKVSIVICQDIIEKITWVIFETKRWKIGMIVYNERPQLLATYDWIWWAGQLCHVPCVIINYLK